MGKQNIYNELVRAQAENLGADPSPGIPGRFLFNTVTGKFRGDNGSDIIDLGGGGGGGGGVVRWQPDDAAPSPGPSTENSVPVWLFSAGETQKLFLMLRVPSTYVAGDQITLKCLAYSPSTSNNFLFTTVATLLVPETDAAGDTTNQRTSTNAALTNSVANRLRVVTFDLTDSSGEINSQPVAAGDLIKVELARGTDTDTADVRLLDYLAELLLS